MIKRFKQTFLRANYKHVLADSALILCSLYISLWLRTGEYFSYYFQSMNRYALWFLAIRILILASSGVYHIMWRYIAAIDAITLGRAILGSSVLIITATYLLDVGRIPRAVFFIDAIVTLLLLGGIRVIRRVIFDRRSSKQVEKNTRNCVIYGAGANGRTLANRLVSDPSLGLRLVAFLDDDPQKHQKFVNGVKVFGGRSELAETLRNFQVQDLIIAISAPPKDLLAQFVYEGKKNNTRVRLVDSLRSSNEKKTLGLLREVKLEDLLGRSRRSIDTKLINQMIQGQTVLVTGAGGSIGSEICRQIFEHSPSQLLLLDHSEYNLYNIDNELAARKGNNTSVVPLLIDLKIAQQVQEVINEYRPTVVLHAAAYKHVHLVETNPISAVLNNIQGTINLVEASHKVGVKHFVLVSTDKAVNPVGVMGATKRVCELIVTHYAKKTGSAYCSVRFGNVLGSSGSLIPLLKKQIEHQEPITITHQDMTRYFMLVPEAVSLVLRAAAIAKPGDTCILKMGQPIKIVDIAKNLIRLMGKNEEDVPIIYTGIRPGEKLYEELYLEGDEVPTEDADILVLHPKSSTTSNENDDTSSESFLKQINSLVYLAMTGRNETVTLLHSIVRGAGYNPPLDVKNIVQDSTAVYPPNFNLETSADV